MKNFRSLAGILGFMVVISTSGGCFIATDPGPEIKQGTGIPWTFNLTNQSGNAITVKVTPLRSNKDGRGLNLSLIHI